MRVPRTCKATGMGIIRLFPPLLSLFSSLPPALPPKFSRLLWPPTSSAQGCVCPWKDPHFFSWRRGLAGEGGGRQPARLKAVGSEFCLAGDRAVPDSLSSGEAHQGLRLEPTQMGNELNSRERGVNTEPPEPWWNLDTMNLPAFSAQRGVALRTDAGCVCPGLQVPPCDLSTLSAVPVQ